MLHCSALVHAVLLPFLCVTGYWDVLHGLAEQRNLHIFEPCPGLVSTLAASGQYQLLACSLSQVCFDG